MPRPHSVESQIPATVKTAYNEYGFAAKLETAVAVRSTDDWFAILFPEGKKSFHAVDFVRDGKGGWEVQNDYVGPFASVEEFQTERLVRTLW